MTYKNKILSLSSAIAVLTIIFILGVIFSPERVQEKRSREKLFNIDLMDTVGYFRISTNEGFAELNRESGIWMVKAENNEYPVSEYKVENFFDSIFNLNKFQTVGTNKEHWEKFDLTEDKARYVMLKNKKGEELFTLYIGKSGPAERGEYIRSTGSDETYLTDGTLKRYFYKDINYWCQLRILPDDVDSTSITSMNITADVDIKGDNFKGELKLVKENDEGNYEWYNPENNEKFQRSKADTIANNISSLVADSYTEERITRKDVVIQIETEKYGKQIIDIQKKDDNEFYLNIRGDKYTLVINQYKIHRVISRIN